MEADDITRLLVAAGDGSDDAMDEVFEVVYPRLKEIARARRRGWQGSHTMNTTGLIHEAYLKVAGSGGKFENRNRLNPLTRTAVVHAIGGSLWASTHRRPVSGSSKHSRSFAQKDKR